MTVPDYLHHGSFPFLGGGRRCAGGPDRPGEGGPPDGRARGADPLRLQSGTYEQGVGDGVWYGPTNTSFGAIFS